MSRVRNIVLLLSRAYASVIIFHNPGGLTTKPLRGKKRLWAARRWERKVIDARRRIRSVPCMTSTPAVTALRSFVRG